MKYVDEQVIEGEEWKSVNINHFNHYTISNKGRLRNKKGNLIRPSISIGYNLVTLKKNLYNKKTIRIHIIVAKTFLENHENLPMVNHKNGNKLDNNVENLEWIDNSGNIKHAYETGLFVPFKRKVVQLTLENDFIKIFESLV